MPVLFLLYVNMKIGLMSWSQCTFHASNLIWLIAPTSFHATMRSAGTEAKSPRKGTLTSVHPSAIEFCKICTYFCSLAPQVWRLWIAFDTGHERKCSPRRHRWPHARASNRLRWGTYSALLSNRRCDSSYNAASIQQWLKALCKRDWQSNLFA